MTPTVYTYYIYGSVLVNGMPKSARYHIDRANCIVLPQKGCHYSLFHPRGIIRWLTNFEK